MNSTVAIITPADLTALTTLERAKLELGISGTDDDEILTAKIGEAGSDIVVRCEPALKRETVTETFYPDRRGNSAEELALRRYPVAAVTTVTIDGLDLDAAEYRVNGEAGLLYRQTLDGCPRQWSCFRSIAVTYAGGYLLPGQDGRDLPPSLEAACIELLSSYWAAKGRDPTLKAEENVGVARFEYWIGTVGPAGDLPPGVMSKIGPYRKGLRA